MPKVYLLKWLTGSVQEAMIVALMALRMLLI